VSVGDLLIVARMGAGVTPPPVRSCFGVTVEPFAFLTGLGVPAMVLCLLKGQTTLNDPVPLLKGGMVGSDNVVEGHGQGLGWGLVNCSTDGGRCDRPP
jgi:hypothetical protein